MNIAGRIKFIQREIPEKIPNRYISTDIKTRIRDRNRGNPCSNQLAGYCGLFIFSDVIYWHVQQGQAVNQ